VRGEGDVVVGGSGEEIEVGEEDGEVGAESFEEGEFGGRGENGEGANQGVDAVEQVLLLDAQNIPIGEIKRHT